MRIVSRIVTLQYSPQCYESEQVFRALAFVGALLPTPSLPQTIHADQQFQISRQVCKMYGFRAATLLVACLADAVVPMTFRDHYLTLTALLSDHSGEAYFECWQMAQPFTHYPTVGSGITGLADVSNVSYVVLPPRSDEGLHKLPHPMSVLSCHRKERDADRNRFFVLLSGLAHVTLLHGEDEFWIMEGVNGLMVAADVEGEGHYTAYPSDKETVALQIAFAGGGLPEHTVLRKGVCHGRGTESERSLDALTGSTEQEVIATVEVWRD